MPGQCSNADSTVAILEYMNGNESLLIDTVYFTSSNTPIKPDYSLEWTDLYLQLFYYKYLETEKGLVPAGRTLSRSVHRKEE